MVWPTWYIREWKIENWHPDGDKWMIKVENRDV